MRNKELTLHRLQKLEGQFKKLDMEIHRGGNRETINAVQREIVEIIQDLRDIVDRENN